MPSANHAKDKKPKPDAETRIVRPENFQTYYSNSVYARSTPWDLQLVFGALSPPPVESSGEEKPTIEQQVRIVMSYQHAKTMLDVVGGLIRKYEEKVGGEVRYPKKAE